MESSSFTGLCIWLCMLRWSPRETALLKEIQDTERVRLDGRGAPAPESGSAQNSSVSQSKEAPAPAGGAERKSPCGGSDQFMFIAHNV